VVVQALDERNAEEGGRAAELLSSKAEKVVSEVFLLELSSAFSRRDDLVSAVASQVTATSAAIVTAYVVYVMSKYGLKLIEAPGEMVFTPMGRVSAQVGVAMGHSAELKLRSLDLLHISHLLVLKERGYPIESVITSDREFLKAEKFLENRGVKVAIPVSHPRPKDVSVPSTEPSTTGTR